MRTRGPLRVGFLSNGFGAHPTGLLTVALLEHLRHDPALQLHLFALNRADGSRIRDRLQAATRLHDVAALRHADIAARIRAQGIDLLFDLRGWGGGGTPEVLAMRPAPLQLNWLAYPGTSGARWLDAVVADEFVLPASLEPHFSERVLRLPRAFQPSDNTRTLEPSRPAPSAACPHRAWCSAASTTATSSTRAAWAARSPCCRRCLAACCGCCPARARPTPACALPRRRRAWIRRAWCSWPSCRTRSTWPGINWPTCSSTRIRTTRTPPLPMRCGPAARC